MRWRGFCVLSLVVLAAAGQAGTSGNGVDAGSFAQFGLGARALGLGGAYTALADDLSALYWNPAGLAFIADPRVGVMYADKFSQGIPFQGFFAISQWDLKATKIYLGGGLVYQALQEEPPADGEPLSESQSLSLGALAVDLSGRSKTFDAVGLGVTLKGYRHSLQEASAVGFGFDLGVIARRDFDWGSLAFGIAARDLGGTKIHWSGTQHEPVDMVPWTNTWEAAWRLLEGRLLLACGITAVAGLPEFDEFHAGLEFAVEEGVFLRMGLARTLQGGVKLSAGAGLRVAGVGLDYAFVFHPCLGPTHLISLEYRWASQSAWPFPEAVQTQSQGLAPVVPGNSSPLPSSQRTDPDPQLGELAPASLNPDALAFKIDVVAVPNPLSEWEPVSFQVKGICPCEVEGLKVEVYDQAGRLLWRGESTGAAIYWYPQLPKGRALANGCYVYRAYVKIKGEWLIVEPRGTALLR